MTKEQINILDTIASHQFKENRHGFHFCLGGDWDMMSNISFTDHIKNKVKKLFEDKEYITNAIKRDMEQPVNYDLVEAKVARLEDEMLNEYLENGGFYD